MSYNDSFTVNSGLLGEFDACTAYGMLLAVLQGQGMTQLLPTTSTTTIGFSPQPAMMVSLRIADRLVSHAANLVVRSSPQISNLRTRTMCDNTNCVTNSLLLLIMTIICINCIAGCPFLEAKHRHRKMTIIGSTRHRVTRIVCFRIDMCTP